MKKIIISPKDIVFVIIIGIFIGFIIRYSILELENYLFNIFVLPIVIIIIPVILFKYFYNKKLEPTISISRIKKIAIICIVLQSIAMAGAYREGNNIFFPEFYGSDLGMAQGLVGYSFEVLGFNLLLIIGMTLLTIDWRKKNDYVKLCN